MGQLVSISDEGPPKVESSAPPPPAAVDNDGEFPEDPWDEELSELVFDLEAATLEQKSSALPSPAIDFDIATPQEVLERVLSLISSPSSRHFERYGAFATKDRQGLSVLLASCLRPEVVKLVESRETSITKYAQLRSITIITSNALPE